jgi:hypothetical protein
MKTKNRFSVVKVGDAKWKVRDAHTGAYVWDWWEWEGRTREEARRLARSQNQKEKLRTAVIVRMEPLSDYLARQKNRDRATPGEQSA